MLLVGDALRINEIIKVTYEVENHRNIAQSAEVIMVDPVKKQGIDEIIMNMTLEEKVGQMFFVRCPSEQEIQDVINYQLCGYILF